VLEKLIFTLTVMATATALAMADAAAEDTVTGEPAPLLYVVNFTADWCPNCKILDPNLDAALLALGDDRVAHVELDMTDPKRTQVAFDRVNGTVLGGVYGDYVGVTGLAVMVAADSGRNIDCATRVMDSEAIRMTIENALEIVSTQPAGTRQTDSFLCPPANRKIRVE